MRVAGICVAVLLAVSGFSDGWGGYDYGCAGMPDGYYCDDGNACTRMDMCRGGVCVGSNPVVCTPVDACHLAGTCDPSSGLCSNPPLRSKRPFSLCSLISGRPE